MPKGFYTHETTTQNQVLDVIQHATLDLLNAAGELARFPWTETSSQIIDSALSIAAKVEELAANSEQLEMPANVIPFRARGGAV